ncbi:hypothetical protein BJV82DRAFT_620654 [Fennellomyces sp. T-0311]|nr:hypothetical protein BJV82DRAFT_620654 [Fennellomyces sp. T-0311]
MYDFTLILPPETTTCIFSFLDPSDHIECVCVCRQWYHCIPDYVSHWNQLYVSPDSWGKASNAMIQCLGPHVRKVCIRKGNTVKVLRALADRKCAITLLEINAHARPIKNDVRQLYGDSIELISAIKPFANTLTELIMTDHPSDISVPHLLNTLPKLTHLTLRFDFKRLTRVSRIDNSNTGKQVESQLVYLELDNSYNFGFRVVPVLRRCARLKALLLATQFPKMTGGYGSAINFDIIFELCPRLRYVMWNQDKYYDPEDVRRSQIWKKLVKHSDNGTASGALRELTFYGDEADLISWIIPILTKSQDTLQYLNITSCDRDPWNPLGHIPLHQLKTLNLLYPKTGGYQWINALIANRRTVQDLELSLMMDNMDHVGQIIVAISSMSSLQRLRLYNNWSMSLQGQPEICRNLALLSQNCQLRRVQFDSISVSDQGLLDLCDIPLLHELCLCMNRRSSRLITVNGYLQFAGKLQLLGSRLHTLSFENCYNITDLVLEHLAHVKSLLALSISRNRQITDAGVQYFVDNGQGEKKINIHGCSSVSRMGLWQRDS